MTDICACTGENCPFKDRCFRFSCPKSEDQSYFAEVPYDEKSQSCNFYVQYKARNTEKKPNAQTLIK